MEVVCEIEFDLSISYGSKDKVKLLSFTIKFANSSFSLVTCKWLDCRVHIMPNLTACAATGSIKTTYIPHIDYSS